VHRNKSCYFARDVVQHGLIAGSCRPLIVLFIVVRFSYPQVMFFTSDLIPTFCYLKVQFNQFRSIFLKVLLIPFRRNVFPSDLIWSSNTDFRFCFYTAKNPFLFSLGFVFSIPTQLFPAFQSAEVSDLLHFS